MERCIIYKYKTIKNKVITVMIDGTKLFSYVVTIEYRFLIKCHKVLR